MGRYRRFLANARPEWDLRYFSNSSALNLSRKAQYQTSSHGLNLAVCGFAGIMVGYPLLQIRGCTGVFLIREIDAAENIDVPHDPALPPARRRPSGYAGHASLFGHPVAAPREARRVKRGGARRDRTADLLHAMQALSQLSYGPSTSGPRALGDARLP